MVGSAPAAAASPSAKQCDYAGLSSVQTAAGLRVILDATAIYAVDSKQYANGASIGFSVAMNSTTSHPVTSVGVLFTQFDTSSTAWTHSKKFGYTAPPKGRIASTAARDGQTFRTNFYRFHGRKVRFILNAQKHNFVTPWMTIGAGKCGPLGSA